MAFDPREDGIRKSPGCPGHFWGSSASWEPGVLSICMGMGNITKEDCGGLCKWEFPEGRDV